MNQVRYDVSVFIGRFQPFHKGHLHNIQKALERSDRIIINIGSSFNAPSTKNPFSFEQRKFMIESDLVVARIDLNNVKIEPIADYFYHEEQWEIALKENVKKHVLEGQSVAVAGYEKDASSYYLKSFPEWGFIAVDNYKNYNATDFRKKFYAGEIPEEYMVSNNSAQGSYAFLTQFMQSANYKWLVDYVDVIKAYKKSWENSPYEPIFVTADALVVVDDKVLVVERKNHPGKDLFALPGGYIESSEFIESSAIRELYEETNIDISREQLALARKGSYVFDYPSRSDRGRVITNVSLFILNSCIGLPKIQASDDAKSVKWVPISVIMSDMYDKFFDDHFQIISILLKDFIVR